MTEAQRQQLREQLVFAMIAAGQPWHEILGAVPRIVDLIVQTQPKPTSPVE